MTTFDRFERNMPALLDELAAPRTPDYFDDILSLTERSSQRPGWSFPERWLPMSAITERMTAAPRAPWRAIGAIALLILALAAAALFVGNQPRKLPAPFGPAGNGLIAYSADGDIFTADAVTGTVTPIVTGPGIDRNPIFSRDGAQVAFRRQRGRTNAADLVVAQADGSRATVVTTDPIVNEDIVEWGPDGASLIVFTGSEEIIRLDSTKAALPVVLATQVDGWGLITGVARLRPPDGAQVLYRPRETEGREIWVMNTDGTGAVALIAKDAGSATDRDFDQFAWSPDGKQIAFNQRAPGESDGLRLFVMNADGSGVRQLTYEPGVWFEADLAWSPDGTQIAFNRQGPGAPTSCYDNPVGGFGVHSIGVVSVDGGPVRGVGPVPVCEGAVFEWSPDGTTILSAPWQVYEGAAFLGGAVPIAIDVATGTSTELEGAIKSATSWQRLAIE